jgi:hypothetical protein
MSQPLIGNDATSAKNPDMLGESNHLMTRAKFLQHLVLDKICDDFENVDQVILREVAEQASKCGLTVQRPEIVAALQALVESGLAKAYDLSATNRDPFSGEMPGMPSLDVVEEYFRTYFYVTEKGMEFHESDGTWWPFDDEGSLRPDWNPPDA